MRFGGSRSVIGTGRVMRPISRLLARLASGAERVWEGWLRIRNAEESRWREDIEGEAVDGEDPAEGSKGCGAGPRAPSLTELVSERQEEARHAASSGAGRPGDSEQG